MDIFFLFFREESRITVQSKFCWKILDFSFPIERKLAESFIFIYHDQNNYFIFSILLIIANIRIINFYAQQCINLITKSQCTILSDSYSTFYNFITLRIHVIFHESYGFRIRVWNFRKLISTSVALQPRTVQNGGCKSATINQKYLEEFGQFNNIPSNSTKSSILLMKI